MNLLSGIVNRLHQTRRSLVYALGFENSIYSFVDQEAFILLFHNVLREVRPDLNVRNFGVCEFENLMRYLKKNYQIVPLSDLTQDPEKRNAIAITFDDGLINNLRYALPVLERLQIPATFFITTGWLRGTPILWPDRWSLISKHLNEDMIFEGVTYRKQGANTYRSITTGEKLTDVFLRTLPPVRDQFIDEKALKINYLPEHDHPNEDCWRLMKGEEIKILASSPYIELGSHCVTHENLLLLSDEEVKNELAESKRYLEQITGKEVDAVAFPFGLYSEKIIQLSLEFGYTKILVVNKLLKSKVSSIYSRLGLYNHQTLAEMKHAVRTHTTVSVRP